MKRHLNFAFPLFEAAPTEGGGGTGTPAGGAGAALATTIAPPAVAGAGGGGADEIDILNYSPPTPDIKMFSEEGEGDDAANKPGAKKDPPPAPVKKDPPPAPPKKDDLAADAPANLVRERLKAVQAESTAKIAELERQLGEAKSDTRIEQLTKKIEDVQRDRETAAKQRDELESKLLVHNPLVSKKLRELESTFNADYDATMDIVPNLKPQYRQLLEEFEALPRGKDEYAAKLQEMKTKLREEFGDDMPTVFGALQKGLKFRGDYAKTAQQVQADARGTLHTEMSNDWKTKHEEYEKQYPGYFEPPADAADKDPLNVKLFLKEFEGGLPKEEVAKVDSNVKRFVDRVINGAQPRRREDFPELDAAAAEKEIARIDGLVREDRAKALPLFSLALKYLMYARPVIAELTRQKEDARKSRGALPPDPTKAADSQGGNGAFDISTYEPPAVPDLAAFGG